MRDSVILQIIELKQPLSQSSVRDKPHNSLYFFRLGSNTLTNWDTARWGKPSSIENTFFMEDFIYLLAIKDQLDEDDVAFQQTLIEEPRDSDYLRPF